MKKNTKALIGCAVALVLAGGGYAAVMLTEEDETATSSTASVESEIDENSVPVPIFEYEKAEVESVFVKNSEGEFTGIPEGKPDEDGNVTFTIEGLEDLDINTTLTGSLLTNSAALQSDSTAEKNPADLEKYGLKTPAAEITVKTASEEKTILVGAESPIEGETYCMEKNGDTVYLVSTTSLSVFMNNKEYFISTTLLETPADEVYPKIEEVRVVRDDLDYDIFIEYDKSADVEGETSGSLATHFMTEPVFAYLDAEKAQTTTHGMFGLAADSIVTAHPTEEEIAASGLAEPFCEVTMVTDEPSTHTLKIGNKLENENGSYYLVMFDDNEVIYAISEANLVWTTLQPGDITSKLIFGIYVWDIATLDIEVKGGESVSFEGSGDDADSYVVTKNGEECDTERFRSFYTFLLKTAAEDFVLDEEPVGEPIVSINIETQDGEASQKVEFYETDSKKVLISVNGSPCFKCRAAYVDLLIDNLEKFDTNEEFVMNW